MRSGSATCVGALIEVEPNSRVPQGPTRHRPALGVQVDFDSVAPCIGDHLCGLRHVATESPDVLV